MVLTSSSRRYGICWDDEIQKTLGEKALPFYTFGGTDNSFDPQTPAHYGGLFDVSAAALTRNYRGDPYEARHLYVSLFGFWSILFTGLLARKLGGWRAGDIALVFLFFSPVFFGHSMFNVKDIPFAAGFITAIYYIFCFIINLPNVRWVPAVGVIAGIAMATNVRIGGLMLIGYLVSFTGFTILFQAYRNRLCLLDILRRYRKAILLLPILCAIAYFCGFLFLPYALYDPIHRPFEALSSMTHFPFNVKSLFAGQWVISNQAPRSYIPVWIWITSPLFINIGLLLVPALFSKRVSGRVGLDNTRVMLLCFTFLFPIGYIIYRESNIYDGWRHLLFVYPSIVVACALAWDKLLVYCDRRLTRGCIALGIGLLVAEPMLWMMRHHTLEAFYFSPVIGGTGGAFKRYDIDYYGTSLRYAVEWIAQHKETLEKGPAGKIRVRCYYGERISVEHFIKKYSELEYVIAREASLDWDYSIIQPTEAKHNPDLLTHWPPKGMVHQIEIDGAPIVAVGRNYNKDIKRETSNISVYDGTNVSALINASLKYYQTGDFLGCIAASERALVLDSSNPLALNNAMAAFNSLSIFDEGIAYGERALKSKPDYDLAKGNLQAALNGKAQAATVSPDKLANTYLDLSLVYYNLHDFVKCLVFSQKVILLRPNDASAYNNVCASYNSMGRYEQAIVAGEKALAINPSFDLARNNLEVARKGLRK